MTAVVPLSPDGVPLAVDVTVAPDGTTFLVTQFHDDAYSVRLNVRRGSGVWRQYWLANDDPFWIGTIELLVDRKIAIIRNYGFEVARFRWETGQLLFRAGDRILDYSVAVGDPLAARSNYR
jgi:hypothetical protein